MSKPSKSATKEERLAAHKRKQMGKFFANLEPDRTGFKPVPKKEK